MRRDDMADLAAFAAVAEEQSFTRASRRLGISQSALSQIVRRLEERLGLRLLDRTTRSVAPTQVGQQLLSTLSVENFPDKCNLQSLVRKEKYILFSKLVK